MSDSYTPASALKRTGVENSDPGAPTEEQTAEPQWNCSFKLSFLEVIEIFFVFLMSQVLFSFFLQIKDNKV